MNTVLAPSRPSPPTSQHTVGAPSPDPYGFLARAPLDGPVLHPKEFGLSKADVAEVKRMQKRTRIVGYTFMQDEPVVICLTDKMMEREHCQGATYSAERNSGFVYTHWITLDSSLTAHPLQFQSLLNHELTHALTFSGTHKNKQAWRLADTKQLKTFSCCADLDRLSWSMSRAYAQLVWFAELSEKAG